MTGKRRVQDKIFCLGYLMNKNDLISYNAIQSSIGEIKTLMAHALPEMANRPTAKFIDRDLQNL